MAEIAGADVHAAGDVRAGEVDLSEVRHGGPDGALVALDPETRRDLEYALFERAGAEPDLCERWSNGGC